MICKWATFVKEKNNASRDFEPIFCPFAKSENFMQKRRKMETFSSASQKNFSDVLRQIVSYRGFRSHPPKTLRGFGGGCRFFSNSIELQQIKFSFLKFSNYN